MHSRICLFLRGIYIVFSLSFALQHWNVHCFRIKSASQDDGNNVGRLNPQWMFLSETTVSEQEKVSPQTGNAEKLQTSSSDSLHPQKKRNSLFNQKQVSLIWPFALLSDHRQNHIKSPVILAFSKAIVQSKSKRARIASENFPGIFVNIAQSQFHKPCISLACGGHSGRTFHEKGKLSPQRQTDQSVRSQLMQTMCSTPDLRHSRCKRSAKRKKVVQSNHKQKKTVFSTSNVDAVISEDQSRVELSLLQQQGISEDQSDFRLASSTDHSSKTSETLKVSEPPKENIIYRGLDGKPVNLTELLDDLHAKEFQRQLNKDAQWAYLCMVLLLCFMMWVIWFLGGFQRCRYRAHTTHGFNDIQHRLSVEEVLRRRQRFLPMFNEPEWEDVLMCERGSNP